MKNEKKVYGIIYKTTCLVNGKVYIGQTIRKDPRYLGSGTMLAKSIAKYGKQNFKRNILMYCYDQEQLNLYEELFIELYSATDIKFGYNILHTHSYGDAIGSLASNPEVRSRMTESMKKFYKTIKGLELRKRFSENQVGEKNHMFGKKQSEKFKKYLSGLYKGRKLSKEHKKVLLEAALRANLGRKLSKEHKEKISKSLIGREINDSTKYLLHKLNIGDKNPMYGKKLSPEQKKKLHDNNRGKKASEEHKKKIGISNMLRFGRYNIVYKKEGLEDIIFEDKYSVIEHFKITSKMLVVKILNGDCFHLNLKTI